MIAQLAADEAGIAQLFELQHAIQVVVQVRERFEMTEQHRRRLAPDARHAGNVVDGVAGQREEAGHALGLHAEAVGDLVVAEALFADVVPVFVARAHQLRQILVARHERRRSGPPRACASPACR